MMIQKEEDSAFILEADDRLRPLLTTTKFFLTISHFSHKQYMGLPKNSGNLIIISSRGTGKSRRGQDQANGGGGITVMFLEVRNCQKTSDV